jgi:hypothetical protein
MIGVLEIERFRPDRPGDRVRSVGARAPRDFAGMSASPIYIGEPGRIVEEMLASKVVTEADTLPVYLPWDFTFDEYREQLEALTTTVAPALGWEPAVPDRPC